MKGIVAKMYELYRPFRKVVIGMFFFIMVAQGLSLVSPLLYGKIIDAIVAKKSMSLVMVFAVLSLLAYLSQNAIWYFRDKFELKYFDYEVSEHISRRTLDKVLSFSVGQHLAQHSGIKQSIINRGEDSLKQVTYDLAYKVFPLVLRLLFTVVALLYLNFLLGSVVFASISVYIGLTIFINLKMGNNLKRHNDMHLERRKMHSEILRNVEIVQLNAQEERMSNEHEGKFRELNEFGVGMWTRYTFFASLRNLIISFTRFAVIVIGVYLVYKKAYTPGYLVVFISWTSNALGQVDNVGQVHRQFMQQITDVKKYLEMMEVVPDIQVVPNPVKPKRIDGGIEFKNVSFKYPSRSFTEDDEVKSGNGNQHEALSGVSFSIEPGQQVAFVGHSGAGKSTLAHLMTRSYDPNEGQIVVDGNDLRILDLKTYREAVGTVEQDVRLFDNTLRYNIAFGLNGRSASVTDAELSDIARASCVDKFFYRLEQGFDTIIGERGIKLSGGERQRVGIARALIKDPRILIFDEATSNLDTENETLIRESIQRVSEGRTTIIIAHRLSTIKHADKIFVLEEGRLVGEGTHDQLIETCAAYRTLVDGQMVNA